MPAEYFLGSRKKTEECFWVVKKGQGIYLGMLKKVVNSEVVIFLGIKYEPLSDPPPLPPSLKFVSGAPGVHVVLTFEPDLLVITNPWHSKLFCLTATWFQAFKALHVCSVLYIYLVSGLPIKSGEMTGVWFLPGELLVD